MCSSKRENPLYSPCDQVDLINLENQDLPFAQEGLRYQVGRKYRSDQGYHRFPDIPRFLAFPFFPGKKQWDLKDFSLQKFDTSFKTSNAASILPSIHGYRSRLVVQEDRDGLDLPVDNNYERLLKQIRKSFKWKMEEVQRTSIVCIGSN